MDTNSTTAEKLTYCHHCGREIAWCETYPDKRNSHWAHAIRVYNGKAHTLGNALMEQRCSDGQHWATPRRASVKWTPQIMLKDA